MRCLVSAFCMLMVLGSATPLPAQDQSSELAEWKAEIAAAAARVRARREEAKADFLRRKADRTLNPSVSDEAELARRASNQVLNDFSLRKGDMVSTTDGVFVFVGKGEGERTPADFVPLPLMQNPQTQPNESQRQQQMQRRGPLLRVPDGND